MKGSVLIIIGLVASISLLGCGKKQESLEEMQEPMSMEALSAIPTQTQAPAEMKAQQQPIGASSVLPQGSSSEVKTEASSVQSLSKPAIMDIQKALKNAGYYTGAIDGKKGPMTKKAIEEFQKANGLQADGKVGPKTWEVLSKYLEVTGTIDKKR